MSHKASPRKPEWVAYPFSSGSSWPRNQTRVSCAAGCFFTNWAIREAPIKSLLPNWWERDHNSTEVEQIPSHPFFLLFFIPYFIQLNIYCRVSVQFTQSCLTLCDPMNRSTLGLPVHHQPPEFTQSHVHWVSDAIQPSHPLSSPSPPAPNPSQHQIIFQWVSSSHEVAKVLEFQLQHHSLQRNPRADLLQNGLVGSPCSPRDSGSTALQLDTYSNIYIRYMINMT